MATCRALSHGNKQKLGLVQAFMHQPELLILDEPTQGLDPLAHQEFYRMIAEACAAVRTVLLSSPVLLEVEKTCDRVGIIRCCTVTGSLDAVIKAAAGFEVMELISQEPSLEEIFLAYYA